MLAYVTKYATKAETKSNVFNAVFVSVFNEGSLLSVDTRLCLRRVMTKVLAERDVTFQEPLHQLLGLDLYNSNITVVKVSLESTARVRVNNNKLEMNTGLVIAFARRQQYEENYRGMSELNFIDFGTQYEVIGKNLRKRNNPNEIVLRIFQRFSSNLKNKNQYPKHCK